jgi:hypothetical protein
VTRMNCNLCLSEHFVLDELELNLQRGSNSDIMIMAIERKKTSQSICLSMQSYARMRAEKKRKNRYLIKLQSRFILRNSAGCNGLIGGVDVS